MAAAVVVALVVVLAAEALVAVASELAVVVAASGPVAFESARAVAAGPVAAAVAFAVVAVRADAGAVAAVSFESFVDAPRFVVVAATPSLVPKEARKPASAQRESPEEDQVDWEQTSDATGSVLVAMMPSRLVAALEETWGCAQRLGVVAAAADSEASDFARPGRAARRDAEQCSPWPAAALPLAK